MQSGLWYFTAQWPLTHTERPAQPKTRPRGKLGLESPTGIGGEAFLEPGAAKYLNTGLTISEDVALLFSISLIYT